MHLSMQKNFWIDFGMFSKEIRNVCLECKCIENMGTITVTSFVDKKEILAESRTSPQDILFNEKSATTVNESRSKCQIRHFSRRWFLSFFLG